ncbi:MAG: hypothetical protein U0359_14330 [Byssovorax sp.]
MSEQDRPEQEGDARAIVPARVVALRSGRQIEIGGEGGEEWITVRSPSGEHLVTMRLGDAGPIFSFSRGSLAIEAAEELSLSAGTLAIEATGSASIQVGGDLHEEVGGATLRRSGGTSTTHAKSIAIEATPGGIDVKAAGEVRLDGERIRLNSDDPPMPLTWEELRTRQGA